MRLPQDREDWPDLYRERFEERAGVIEYEANFPRWKAEIMAESDIRKQAAEEWGELT